MKKRTKVLIGILIVIAIIAIVCLALFLKIMLIVSNSTVVGVEDNRIVTTAVEKVCEQEYKLDDVILKNLSLVEIDKSNVKVGDYIYLFIENDYTYYYCENTNYYSKVLEINDDNIKVAIPDWQFYSFNAEDANIKDDNGNKIDISDLKLGDDIQIISILPDSIPDIAEIFEGYPSKSIYNVKNVKIKETNESLKENFENRDMIAIKKAIIAGVNKNSLCVIDSENNELLYEVYFSDEGNIGFEPGQEILIYFNGKSLIGGMNGINYLGSVGKIEITGNEYNELVTADVLKKFYTNFDNVDVSIDNLTTEEITTTVTDDNYIKYNFTNNFALQKNIAIKPSKPAIQTEPTDNMVLGAYTGDEWQELTKISDSNLKNVVNIEQLDENTTRISCNWKDVYESLGSGEYRFFMEGPGKKEKISIRFTVNDNGKISDVNISKGY